MPVFGLALDPELWLGELYREDPEGYLVQRGDSTVYLPRYLAKLYGERLDDPAAWELWHREFMSPVQEQEIAPWAETRGKQKRKPAARPAGGASVMSISYSLLEIKLDDVVVVYGTKEAGINVEVDDVSLVSGGEGSITVKVDNA